jgi:hypothetical protein
VSLLFDHVDTCEAGRDEAHAISIRACGPCGHSRTRTSGMGTTNFPPHSLM